MSQSQTHAFVRFTMVAPPVVVAQEGAVGTITRNAAGDYTIALTRPLAVAERHSRAQVIHNAVRGGVAVEEVDASTLRVRAADAAGALADGTQLVVSVDRTRFLRT